MIGAMILGLFAGGIARMLVPTRGAVRGCFPTMAVGLGGALIGWLIFTVGLGVGDTDIFDLGGLIGAIIGSVLLLVILGAVAQGRNRNHPGSPRPF